MATIDDFKRIEMKIGTILVAEYIEGADKLLRLEVDFGLKPRSERGSPDPASRDLGPERNAEGNVPAGEEARLVVAAASPRSSASFTIGERDIRQILSGIREYYSPEQLIGKQCPFVTNVEPRTLRGLTSNGMILAVKTGDGAAVLLHPEKPTEAGDMLS